MFIHKITTYIKSVFSDTRALGLIGFALVASMVAYNSAQVIQKNYELEKRISSLKQRNEVLKLENENQKLRNKYFESDAYVELTARRQLGKAKEGERLYLIPRSLAEASSVEIKPFVEETKPTSQSKNKYQKNIENWVRFFRGEPLN